MRRLLIFRLGLLALLVVLLAAFAPSVGAAGNTNTPWLGLYYNGILDKSVCQAPPAGGVSRVDGEQIAFFWREGTSPIPGRIGVDHYTVCWNRVYYFNAGTYTVSTLNDDGMDVWVNGQIWMDAWYDQGPDIVHNGDITISSAGWYQVTVAYYNDTRGGTACVTWAQQGQAAPWNCPYPNGVNPPPAPPVAPVVPANLSVEIQAWLKLLGPSVVPTRPVPSTRVCSYQVRLGDNLTMIAARYHTTIWNLAAMNRISNMNLIYAGMWLRVPC